MGKAGPLHNGAYVDLLKIPRSSAKDAIFSLLEGQAGRKMPL
jgi:hypothetical protein